MATAQEILEELRPLGSAGYKKVLFNHGIQEPCFGVKISDLQVIRKRIKKDYRLALDLYATGNYDAMYLAGLIADDERMTKADLNRWVQSPNARALTGSAIAWVAAGSPDGWELALEWIDSAVEQTAAAGWGTLSSIVSIRADEDLDLAALKNLLKRAGREISKAPDLVRYQMNGFVIAVGSHVAPLTEAAIETAEKIGRVTADLGNNACETPFAPDYIRKVQQRGSVGKKRKSAKC
jgi:3-methyladenine DNA glycosylase AlkD